ncbi:MAG: TetR/AcrR family transcriptional regulator [Bacillota bacterium]
MAPRPKNPPPDRRQEILEAALRIFAEKGYNATTNADIARAAGVTPAALYYYFANKEELFREAVAGIRRGLEPDVSRVLTEEILQIPPGQLFPMIIRNLIGFLTQERTQAVFKIVLAEGPRDPAIMSIWVEQMFGVVGGLFGYLQHHMELGNVRRMDPRLFFLALMGPIMATVITRNVLKIPLLANISDEMLIETVLQTSLKGLLTEPTE